jgi:DNA-directed RNA polymerase specialized sigma24 family protein
MRGPAHDSLGAPKGSEGRSGAVRVRPEGVGALTDLEGFYRSLYLPLVRHAVWRHKLVAEEARDIVQDAFVLAITKMRAQGNPRVWLFHVVDNLCLNQERKLRRRSRLAAKWLSGAESGEQPFDLIRKQGPTE